jgi:methylthioribose-1-phosphate isomerase
MNPVQALRWGGEQLELLDQRELPQRVCYRPIASARDAAAAIRDMVVRGAPAIGCAAAFGVALEAQRQARENRFEAAALDHALSELRASRPTAVNLFWALDRMERTARGLAPGTSPAERAARLVREAEAILSEDLRANLAMGRHGAALLPDGACIMTHCNAGALATAGHGTALGVIRSARDAGKRVRVIANETRPYLQGARLTAWEMVQEGIPVTLSVDAAAGHLIASGQVDAIIVGADRIAANGDVVNKIGTYTLAVLAQRHAVPFYVAAPLSSFDRALENGAGIVIEERPGAEVTGFRGAQWAPEGVRSLNPAFDLTPHPLVSAIITEHGIIRTPTTEAVARHFSMAGPRP